MKNKVAIFLFTKGPVKGLVKTRLKNFLSDYQIIQLQKFFIKECIKKINTLESLVKYIFYFPPKSKKFFKRYKNYKLYPQKGRSFNKRIKNSFLKLFKIGHQNVICIGSDHPDLPLRYIKDAVKMLQYNDVVIGPTLDGGYYLIGFNKNRLRFRDIFELFQIKPSHNKTFKEMKYLLKKKKIAFFVLPKWYDIDMPKDFISFKKRNKSLLKNNKQFIKIFNKPIK